MQLTEQHIIKTDEWKHWCVKAKELYNQTLYYYRQSLFKNIEYFSEYELSSLFAEYNEPTFRALPSNTSQQIIKQVFKNAKSWQRARKEYAKNPSKFLGRPKMPKYKKGLSEVIFSNVQVKHKEGYIHFPKMIGIEPIKTKIPKDSKLGACRIIPKANHFVIEFVYEVLEKPLKEYNGNFLGIDLGMNNLATCITKNDSFLINGKPLKSINQFYNKRKAKLQSCLPNGIYTSKRINRITFKRNNIIKNYVHHTSKYIVEQSKKQNITKIIIGNNKQMKSKIDLGSKTNQNFVSLPFATLIEQIKYKAKIEGIEVVTTEEAYTSKCSALDLEPICKHENYVGRRVKRGLFVTAQGKLINADANGALNIVRKVIGDDFLIRFDKSCVVQPSKIKVFAQNTLKSKTL